MKKQSTSDTNNQHRTTIVLPKEIQKQLTELRLLTHLSASSVISMLISRETERRYLELIKLREKRAAGYCEVID